ncbi:TrmH family RNA methyltransferase [Granulicella pectinivorans]|nr:RNA methyltransferase [Granulicella pectinivorans]
MRESAAMPDFVVTSRANARVKQLRAATSGNARLSGGLIAIEGETLVHEALRSGLLLKTVFVSERRVVPRGLPAGVEVLRCSNEVLQSAVETQSPQGIAALVLPKQWDLAEALRGEPLLLVAVGLQDPGNLGTLIRSAEAFGATGVLTTLGTVNAWNQKALRASAGSVFRMPVVAVTEAELVGLKARGIRLFAAVAAGENVVAAGAADFTQDCALLIGNEGAGLGQKFIDLADALITIPCPGPVESLNAAIAGSLLLYEASRQRGVSE